MYVYSMYVQAILKELKVGTDFHTELYKVHGQCPVCFHAFLTHVEALQSRLRYLLVLCSQATSICRLSLVCMKNVLQAYYRRRHPSSILLGRL